MRAHGPSLTVGHGLSLTAGTDYRKPAPGPTAWIPSWNPAPSNLSNRESFGLLLTVEGARSDVERAGSTASRSQSIIREIRRYPATVYDSARCDRLAHAPPAADTADRRP